MKKLILTFIGIVIVTILSFGVMWTISPIIEREKVIATQGIRLVNSTTLTNTAEGIPLVIKVGDLFSDPSGTIFRINEIRRTQTGSIYVLVSSKSLKSFKNYTDYLSRPYKDFYIVDLKYFIQGKSLISDSNIEKFYLDNLLELEKLQMMHSNLVPNSYQTHAVSIIVTDS